jgi:hypothetical protein
MVFLLETWFAPLFADIVEHSIVLDYYDANRAPWSITGFGPLGTMMSPWDPAMQTMAGLYWQVGVAVLMVLIALLVEQKRRKTHRAARPTDSSLPIPPLPA